MIEVKKNSRERMRIYKECTLERRRNGRQNRTRKTYKT